MKCNPSCGIFRSQGVRNQAYDGRASAVFDLKGREVQSEISSRCSISSCKLDENLGVAHLCAPFLQLLRLVR